MKTLTITQAKPLLRKLVDEVHAGETVQLAHRDKLVRLVRVGELDPEADSPELESELLKAVRGPHSPWSQAEMQRRAQRIISDTRGRKS